MESILSYGPVRIMKGKHKGKLGYYDDDEFFMCKECKVEAAKYDDPPPDCISDKCELKCVVYLDTPFYTAPVYISYDYLVEADKFEPVDNIVNMNPEGARILGIVATRKGI